MGRAGFGVRLTAGLIDFIAIILLYWVFNLIMEPGIDSEHPALRYRLGIALGTVLAIAYTITDAILGATPGKLLFKLRVTGPMGEPAGGRLWVRYALRWGFLVLNVIVGFSFPSEGALLLRYVMLMIAGAVVAYFTMMATSYGWALYDRWAGTSVTQLGYLSLPPGLGRLIYWNPAAAGGPTGSAFPVVMPAASGGQAPLPAVPPTMPLPPEVPATTPTPPPAHVGPPAGPGAPVGDVPTVVSRRKVVDEPIPLEDPTTPPPPPGAPGAPA